MQATPDPLGKAWPWVMFHWSLRSKLQRMGEFAHVSWPSAKKLGTFVLPRPKTKLIYDNNRYVYHISELVVTCRHYVIWFPCFSFEDATWAYTIWHINIVGFKNHSLRRLGQVSCIGWAVAYIKQIFWTFNSCPTCLILRKVECHRNLQMSTHNWVLSRWRWLIWPVLH